MWQGDCNAPAIMVRTLNGIFKDMIYKVLIIYIDDIIISSRNHMQHVQALQKVLQHLQDQEFCLQQTKCHLVTKRSDILANILTREVLSAHPLKLQKIFNFPVPTDKRSLQAFIEIVNYWSKFLPNLVSTARIPSDLPGTTRTGKWTDTHVEAFNQYTELIDNGQVIQPLYNTREEPKYLICDGSDIGLGSWLGQVTLDRIRSARFLCCKFKASHFSYYTLQKELQAIIDSLNFFKGQLRWTKFTILSDHKASETFMDRPQGSQKPSRWLEYLVSFDQTIVHIAGNKNFMTYASYRNYIRSGTSTKWEDFIP